MNIVNLTPHDINIMRVNLAGVPEHVITIPPSEEIARLNVERAVTSDLTFANEQQLPEDGMGGILLYKTVFGDPTDLPPQRNDTIYIVSSLFRSGYDRGDLYVPGELVRDDIGNPIGCLGLSR